jgi:UDP-N-acetylmuramate dehydrogenase
MSDPQSRSILSKQDRDALTSAVGEAVIRFDEPLSRHTTLKIGGPADAWVAPDSAAALAAVIRVCLERSLPMMAIGGGSNLLVRDGGVRGVVLSTRQLRGLSRDGSRVQVEAGVSTGKLLSSATGWELGGLEFLGGVPGSVGGGLVMNAGTYLGEFKDVTTEVESLRLSDGEQVVRDNAACEFVYRGSALPKDEVVVRATLELTSRSKEEIQADVKALRARRKEREPKGASNAGSVFKNPEGDYAGRLIETVGFKGTRAGNAECSPVHANWFVNHGGATASDMLTLIAEASRLVREQHGIDLKLEWKIIGED